MKLDPLTPFEIRQLRKAHDGWPKCQECYEPQRCLIGRLLDTIHVQDAKPDEPPKPAEF